jgi:hypothetical protein
MPNAPLRSEIRIWAVEKLGKRTAQMTDIDMGGE